MDNGKNKYFTKNWFDTIEAAKKLAIVIEKLANTPIQVTDNQPSERGKIN